MHSRLYVPLAALALLPLVAGCVQATRHSNTMIFGTSTSFGIKVGTAANQTPSILVGYDRQELVLMPLLANTGEHRGGGNNGNLLSPCNLTQPLNIRPQVPGYLVHPCSFVAFKGGSMDSYSVLASFGAEFDASSGSSPEASGGLAQYFATGMAAQILAARGGAALVSTSTEGETPASSALDGLFPEGTAFARPAAIQIDNSFATMAANIRAETSPQSLRTKLNGFLQTLSLPYTGLSLSDCSGADACVEALSTDWALIASSPNLGSAVEGWPAN